MKRILLSGLVLAGLLAFQAPAARADSYSRGNSDHPLRYVAYAVHPIGVALEYGVARPIHWLVSRKHLNVIFGHEPRPEDTYFVWH